MSELPNMFELFEKLERKIQQAMETIALLQMEVEELKEENADLNKKLEAATERVATTESANSVLQIEQENWQERLRGLLGKLQDV